MIEELTQWRGGTSASRLLAIHGVQSLIHKLAENAEEVDPLRDADCEGQIVIHIGKCTYDVNDQTCQGYQIGRHTLNRKIGIAL